MNKKIKRRSKKANPFWAFSPHEAAEAVGADLKNGLSEQEAKARLQKYGYNTLKAKRRNNAFLLFLRQFNNPLIYILLFCSAVSLILYDKTDAFIILSIIIASGVLSFFQEKSALRATEKLLKMIQIKSKVIRGQKPVQIPSEQVVPGDIVHLSTGDLIPGDCYLLEGKNLNLDEATLTGESFNAEKTPGRISADTPLAKRTNTLYMGTHVVSGSATALVMQTGFNTEFGKISQKLNEKVPETEFEKGIRLFGVLLLKVTLIILVIILGFNVYLKRTFMESLLFSVALGVGLTPQLLPAIISINLAKGARRMAKKKVIVKRQSSIEDFGSMNMLCCDKTGTLTYGDIELEMALNMERGKSDKAFLFGYVNAHFQETYSNSLDKAILSNRKMNVREWSKIGEVPYSFERKLLTLHMRNGMGSWVITKGAFEQVLKICTKVEKASGSLAPIKSHMKALQKNYEEFSNRGYRIIGIAYRKEKKQAITEKDERQMIFLGFLLFLDRPKEHILQHVEGLKNLGIGLKVITGDNKFMALHLAGVLGIPQEKILTGKEMQKIDSAELVHWVKNKTIFAEIEPNQKEQIILALKRAKYVVGYLGDGINDVPALHSADVSISVDTGSDVTKEVADIILLKKDLSVLQEGVRAGRVTFANTLKYIFMATSANFGNMFSMAGASVLLSFLPLLPKQILFVNLLEDFPEMTIATDHVDEERIANPVKWNISFIKKFMITFGLISSVFDYATFGILYHLKVSVEQFRTGWFVESVLSAALIVLIVRTFRPFYKSLPSKSLLISVLAIIGFACVLPLLPWAHLLGLTKIPLFLYGIIFGLIVFYALFVELAKKYILKRWLN